MPAWTPLLYIPTTHQGRNYGLESEGAPNFASFPLSRLIISNSNCFKSLDPNESLPMEDLWYSASPKSREKRGATLIVCYESIFK